MRKTAKKKKIEIFKKVYKSRIHLPHAMLQYLHHAIAPNSSRRLQSQNNVENDGKGQVREKPSSIHQSPYSSVVERSTCNPISIKRNQGTAMLRSVVQSCMGAFFFDTFVFNLPLRSLAGFPAPLLLFCQKRIGKSTNHSITRLESSDL